MNMFHTLLQLPVVSTIKKKIISKYKNLKYENEIIARQVVDLRIQVKALKGEKINVVFLCHRPAVWRSAKSIYEFLKQDERVKCIIVTFPQLTPLGTYDDEKADEYFSGNEDLVKGFNKATEKFIDLKTLDPDYVYRSDVVSKYAKICYLSYFTYMANLKNGGVDEECYQLDFLKNVSFFFAQDSNENDYLKKRFADVKIKPVVSITGYPKYDNLNEYMDNDSEAWKGRTWNGKFRIIWTPRWTTNENACHFFDYKDKLLDWCSKNDAVDFLFRPHPQAWVEWNHTGEFPQKEADIYKAKYCNIENAFIDTTPEYLRTFYHSNCLITDTSSVVPEYFLSGKPIIYCYGDNSRYQFEKGKGFSDGLYWVRNWSELEETLQMLIKGEDPLKEKRMWLINSYLDKKNSAGSNIGKIIITDAYGK